MIKNYKMTNYYFKSKLIEIEIDRSSNRDVTDEHKRTSKNLNKNFIEK